MVLQHHERCDGRGYPRGLVNKEIHRFSKIAGISDVYDALTTNRPYKRAMSPFKTLKLMIEEMREQFDSDYLAAFVKFIGLKKHK